MSDVESNAAGGYTGRVTTVTRVESGFRDDEIRVWSRSLSFRNGLLESTSGETFNTVRTRFSSVCFVAAFAGPSLDGRLFVARTGP